VTFLQAETRSNKATMKVFEGKMDFRIVLSLISLAISIDQSLASANGTQSSTSAVAPNSTQTNARNSNKFVFAFSVYQNRSIPKLAPNQTNLAKDGDKIPPSARNLNPVNRTTLTKLDALALPKLSSSKSSAGNSSGHFAEQAEASLFRPSFLRGLLRNQKSTSNQQKEGEEEEEVTQTIVMPIKDETKLDQEKPTSFPVAASVASGEFLPEPEASLQLTSTEINNILNDREAPEFYREREVNDDGVLVAEEQPRAGAAASDLVHGPAPGGSPYASAPFGAKGRGFVNQQLSHAASEGSGLGGFNHMFGQELAGGADFGPTGQDGKLMQSPNSFNEFVAGADLGQGAFAGSNEDSPNSGLLRAGSGDFAGPMEGGSGFYGYGGGGGLSAGASAGYPNSPILGRHSSELYGAGMGGGGGGFGPMSSPGAEFGSAYNGAQLTSAGSHQPEAGSFPYGADEYSNRFGRSEYALDQRGFTTQNNMLLQGNSMQSNTMHEGERGGLPQGPRRGSKLMPLSPVIPIPEEVSSPSMSSQSSSYPREMSTLDHEANRYSQFRYRQQASASDEFATQNQQSAEFRQQQQQQQQAPQVHEALDDDVASEALEGNQELGGGSMSASQSSGQDSYSGQGEPGAGSEDEPTPSTMASVHEMRSRSANSETGNGHSLVLNVPPPSNDNSIRYNESPGRQAVEFRLVGSAGYLAPSLSRPNEEAEEEEQQQRGAEGLARGPMQGQRFTRKTSANLEGREERSSQQGPNAQQQALSADYDPADNPAHAGKYIIE